MEAWRYTVLSGNSELVQIQRIILILLLRLGYYQVFLCIAVGSIENELRIVKV